MRHVFEEIRQCTEKNEIPLNIDHIEEPLSNKVTVPLLSFVQTKMFYMLLDSTGNSPRNELNRGHGEEWARRVFRECSLIEELDRRGLERSICGVRLQNPPMPEHLESLRRDLASKLISPDEEQIPSRASLGNIDSDEDVESD